MMEDVPCPVWRHPHQKEWSSCSHPYCVCRGVDIGGFQYFSVSLHFFYAGLSMMEHNICLSCSYPIIMRTAGSRIAGAL